MQLLLDTHVFLWSRIAPEKISEKVLSAYYDLNNETHLSMVSIWEMQIKQQLGKLEIEFPISHLIEQQQRNNGLQIVSIESWHIYGLNNLR